MTKREFVDDLISKYIETEFEYKRTMCVDIEKQTNCDANCDACQEEYYEKLQESLMEQYDESEDSNDL